jgi:hypothetical protein
MTLILWQHYYAEGRRRRKHCSTNMAQNQQNDKPTFNEAKNAVPDYNHEDTIFWLLSILSGVLTTSQCQNHSTFNTPHHTTPH